MKNVFKMLLAKSKNFGLWEAFPLAELFSQQTNRTNTKVLGK